MFNVSLELFDTRVCNGYEITHPGRRANLTAIGDLRTLVKHISDSFDLVAFNLIWGPFGALASHACNLNTSDLKSKDE